MSKRIFKDNGGHLPEFCRPAADLLASIGDKWTIPVLGNLSDGTKRFSELRDAIGGGISQRMLTLTLRSLERDGMVVRCITPTIPPRVDYALTDRGRDMVRQLRPLHDWALANRDAIAQSRRAFDESQA